MARTNNLKMGPLRNWESYWVHWNDGTDSYVTTIPAHTLSKGPSLDEIVKTLVMLECETLEQVTHWDAVQVTIETMRSTTSGEFCLVDAGTDTFNPYDPVPILKKLIDLQTDHRLRFALDEVDKKWVVTDLDGNRIDACPDLPYLIDYLTERLK